MKDKYFFVIVYYQTIKITINNNIKNEHLEDSLINCFEV